MLLAMGAGSSIAAAGGLPAAAARRGEHGDGSGDGQGDGDGGDGGESGECPPCVDEYSGYLVPAGTADGRPQPQDVDPVETVELRVEDADVVFPEPGEGGGTTETATPAGTPTETETPTATETPAGTPTGTDGDGGAPADGFPDFIFDPVGVHVQPGDAIEFLTVNELHTVTAYHPRFHGVQQRVPDGVPGFSSPPLVDGDTWYYVFDETGVYDLQCLPHEFLGMTMRVVVSEGDDAPEAPPLPAPGEAGPSPIAATVLGAPELEPATIVEEGTVAWEDLTGVASEPPGFN